MKCSMMIDDHDNDDGESDDDDNNDGIRPSNSVWSHKKQQL